MTSSLWATVNNDVEEGNEGKGELSLLEVEGGFLLMGSRSIERVMGRHGLR